MTTEQQRRILEGAAKACGVKLIGFADVGCWQGEEDEWGYQTSEFDRWNPLTNPADTAEMCAKLEIDTEWNNDIGAVCCIADNNISYIHAEAYEGHDNSRLKAWMFAATMCAAKIGGYADD